MAPVLGRCARILCSTGCVVNATKHHAMDGLRGEMEGPAHLAPPARSPKSDLASPRSTGELTGAPALGNPTLTSAELLAA